MSKALKIAAFILLVTMILMLWVPRLYQKWYWEAVEGGFHRGALWEARYEQCFPGKALSESSQKYLAHFVDDPFQHSCEVVGALAETGKRKP